MKKYDIPINWVSLKIISVEAEDLQSGIIKALKQFLSEPDENYLEDTFEIDGIINDYYPDEKFNIYQIMQSI